MTPKKKPAPKKVVVDLGGDVTATVNSHEPHIGAHKTFEDIEIISMINRDTPANVRHLIGEYQFLRNEKRQLLRNGIDTAKGSSLLAGMTPGTCHLPLMDQIIRTAEHIGGLQQAISDLQNQNEAIEKRNDENLKMVLKNATNRCAVSARKAEAILTQARKWKKAYVTTKRALAKECISNNVLAIMLCKRL
jgi:hypothetical protein